MIYIISGPNGQFRTNKDRNDRHEMTPRDHSGKLHEEGHMSTHMLKKTGTICWKMSFVEREKC